MEDLASIVCIDQAVYPTSPWLDFKLLLPTAVSNLRQFKYHFVALFQKSNPIIFQELFFGNWSNIFFTTEVIYFLPVQKQPDAYNCGLFAIAFAAELIDGKSPSDAMFSVEKMRGHLIKCLQEQKLTPFPKRWYLIHFCYRQSWYSFLVKISL